MIRKSGNEWCLYSKDGSKKLFCDRSKQKVQNREREILRIKHAKESEMNGSTKETPSGNGNSKTAQTVLVELMRMMRDESLSPEQFKRIATASNVDLEESFLEPNDLLGPLFPPYAEQTISDFNDRYLFKGKNVKEEEIDVFGRKLAKIVSSWSSNGSAEREYDENGEEISSSHDVIHNSETEWTFQDGKVIRTKSRTTDGRENETEIVEPAGSEEGISPTINEIEWIDEAGAGGVIKMLRRRKKMTAAKLAAKTKLSELRIKEIEDGSDVTDDELEELANGLGMKKASLAKVVNSFSGIENNTNVEQGDIVKIVEETIKIIPPKFTREIFEEFNINKHCIPKHVVNQTPQDTCHGFVGGFLRETFQEQKDGSLRFSVALFKEGELTYNNNRYTKECSKNLMEHLKNLNKKNSTLEETFLEALKEGVSKTNDAARSMIESMRSQPLLMLASHDARQGKGNFLKDVAGRVLGGRREKIEGDMCFVLDGKTVNCPTGNQVAGLIREGVLRGVSLFSYPLKAEENDEGGHDVDNMLLAGADFTNEGGNLRQFKDRSLASPMIA